MQANIKGKIMEKVIYIEGCEASRKTYKSVFEGIYGQEFKVLTVDPNPSGESLLTDIQKHDDVIAIIVGDQANPDSGIANKALKTASVIRKSNRNIPIYVLSEGACRTEFVMGDVDIIIDRNKLSEPNYKRQITAALRRRTSSLNDVKSAKAARYDQLMKKQLKEGLSIEEIKELEGFGFISMKMERLISSDVQESNRLLMEDLKKKMEEAGCPVD